MRIPEFQTDNGGNSTRSGFGMRVLKDPEGANASKYFENVCSNNLMNKMQLKLLGFLAYKIRSKMTEHKRFCFESDSSFFFWSS